MQWGCIHTDSMCHDKLVGHLPIEISFVLCKFLKREIDNKEDSQLCSCILTNLTKDTGGWTSCSRNIHSIVSIAKVIGRDKISTTKQKSCHLI